MAQEKKQPTAGGGYGYGKGKKMWLWILIYMIVGGLAYYLIYAAYAKKHGGSLYGNSAKSGSLYGN